MDRLTAYNILPQISGPFSAQIVIHDYCLLGKSIAVTAVTTTTTPILVVMVMVVAAVAKRSFVDDSRIL